MSGRGKPTHLPLVLPELGELWLLITEEGTLPRVDENRPTVTTVLHAARPPRGCLAGKAREGVRSLRSQKVLLLRIVRHHRCVKGKARTRPGRGLLPSDMEGRTAKPGL